MPGFRFAEAGARPESPELQERTLRSEARDLPDTAGPMTEAERLPETIDTERMELFTIRFRCPDNCDRSEYVRQLKNQEKGMNRLSVADYMKNRERYKEMGRAPEGSEAQRIARQKAIAIRIENNMDSGMSYADAKAEAETYMESQAALHDPDQIAGGFAERVTGMGDRVVNSSIGSQWRDRIGALDDAVEVFARGKSVSELKNCRLHVTLNLED